MMSVAQSDEVFGVGGTAVFPVFDVVYVEPPASITSRHPTAPVTLLDHHPGAVGHRPEGSAHAHRLATGLEHRTDASIAADEAAHAGAHPGAEVEVAVGVPALVGADVEEDEVALVMRARRTTERPVGHGHEGIGPAHVVGARVRRRVVLAGPEQLVASGDQRPLDQRSLIRWQLGRKLPGARSVLPKFTFRGSAGVSGSFGSVGSPSASSANG